MNNNMMILSIISVSIIAIMIVIYNFIDVIYKRRKAETIIEGREYRRVHGLFDPAVYKNSQKAEKDMSFLRQRNTGPDPLTFNKSIQCMDYCEDKSRLVIKRR